MADYGRRSARASASAWARSSASSCAATSRRARSTPARICAAPSASMRRRRALSTAISAASSRCSYRRCASSSSRAASELLHRRRGGLDLDGLEPAARPDVVRARRALRALRRGPAVEQQELDAFVARLRPRRVPVPRDLAIGVRPDLAPDRLELVMLVLGRTPRVRPQHDGQREADDAQCSGADGRLAGAGECGGHDWCARGETRQADAQRGAGGDFAPTRPLQAERGSDRRVTPVGHAYRGPR